MGDIQSPAGAAASSPTRFVVFHRPGPQWNHAVGPLEQAGVAEHFGFLQGLFDSGFIAVAGPFLGTRDGGMMVTRAGLEQAEAERIVATDPAVRSGLIGFECQAWLTTLSILPAVETP